MSRREEMIDGPSRIERETDRHLTMLEKRRFAAEERAYDRLDRQLNEAAALIGELCKEGKQVFYINQRSKTGRPTGKIVEGTRAELINYLIRNHYV